MRDTVVEDLIDQQGKLRDRFTAHCAKKFPLGSLVTFMASGRARNESNGRVLGPGHSIGTVRLRFIPRAQKTRWGRETAEWEWKVRDIPIREICTVLPPDQEWLNAQAAQSSAYRFSPNFGGSNA